MLDQTNANIERHIKTHTERSDDDRSAVSVLETFLRSNGRINTSFASDDKWPNHDGTFEFVPNPEISRRPVQTFYVQIKGTRNYTEREGVIKYTLKDLAFICGRVSLDPGILFVILNPAERGDERVFWKYMSPSFLNSIDFAKDSILPSEKAFAYKMKLDAIKHQGVTSAQVGQRLLSVEKVADDAGESRNQIKRYIRLTYLIPELLSMVDDGKIAFNPAVELSYLDSYQQRAVLDAMALNDCTPSHAQSIHLKKLAQEGFSRFSFRQRRCRRCLKLSGAPSWSCRCWWPLFMDSVGAKCWD